MRVFQRTGPGSVGLNLRELLVQQAIAAVDARIEEFWQQVDKKGPVVSHVGTPCWIWIGNTKARGYGQFWIGGEQVYCHRIAWILEHGPVPEGSSVLHDCDVSLCVNPSHLFLGTQLDNARDREAKGRGRTKGSANPMAKYDPTLAATVRKLRAEGMSYARIAKEIGTGKTTAYYMANGIQWKDAS